MNFGVPKGKPEGIRLHGAVPQFVDPVDLDPTISPLFLRNPTTDETLPLFAFFDVDDVEELPRWAKMSYSLKETPKERSSMFPR